jgi:putative (di)nucleoside polyphosphate hydrolase
MGWQVSWQKQNGALRYRQRREIDIAHPGGGHKPEFVEWRWVAMRELPTLVIPFKRHTYERVVKEFEQFAR